MGLRGAKRQLKGRHRFVAATCAAFLLWPLVAIDRHRLAIADDGPACAKPRKVQIARGIRPDPRWRVLASVKNNGSCDKWLFGMEFRLPDATNWGSGTGIEAYGHLSPAHRIEAFDGSGAGDKAAFSGYVGSAAGKVRASLADGTSLDITPRFPAKQWRQRYQWLRGFVYFVRYHDAKAPVVSVSVFNRQGKLLYRVAGQDGSFF